MLEVYVLVNLLAITVVLTMVSLVIKVRAITPSLPPSTRFQLKGEIPWRKILAACGAILFVISDIVLAVNKFCWPVVGERYIIMVTYYAAQLCISLSAVNSCLVHPAPPQEVAMGDKKNQTFNLRGTKAVSDSTT